MSRVTRTLLTIIATLGLALLVPISSVVAADCSLTGSPKSGVPGTKFVFKGQGFAPTTLTLTRGNEDPQSTQVGDGNGTSFRFELVAQDIDVGRWTAIAEGCEDTASIRVTLPPTATEAPTTTASATDETAQLAGMTLLGVLFLGATALILPRLTRAARSR